MVINLQRGSEGREGEIFPPFVLCVALRVTGDIARAT